MKLTLILALALCALLIGQTIRPDGAIKTTVDHRVDLSSCDQVKIEGPVRELTVSNGQFSYYGFKTYGLGIKITCSIDQVTSTPVRSKDGKR